MKKFIARTGEGASCTQDSFDDLQTAISWIGSCNTTTGVVFRNSTNTAIYKIERGKLTIDKRMKREKED